MTNVLVDNEHISTVLDSNEFLVTPLVQEIMVASRKLNNFVVDSRELPSGDYMIADTSLNIKRVDSTLSLVDSFTLPSSPDTASFDENGGFAAEFYNSSDNVNEHQLKYYDSNGNNQWTISQAYDAVVVQNDRVVAPRSTGDSPSTLVAEIYDKSNGNLVTTVESNSSEFDHIDGILNSMRGKNNTVHIFPNYRDPGNSEHAGFLTLDLDTNSFTTTDPIFDERLIGGYGWVSFAIDSGEFVYLDHQDEELYIFDTNGNKTLEQNVGNINNISTTDDGTIFVEDKNNDSIMKAYESSNLQNVLYTLDIGNIGYFVTIGKTSKRVLFPRTTSTGDEIAIRDTTIPNTSAATYKLEFESNSGVTVNGVDIGNASSRHLIDSGDRIELNGLVSGFRVK